MVQLQIIVQKMCWQRQVNSLFPETPGKKKKENKKKKAKPSRGNFKGSEMKEFGNISHHNTQEEDMPAQ